MQHVWHESFIDTLLVVILQKETGGIIKLHSVHSLYIAFESFIDPHDFVPQVSKQLSTIITWSRKNAIDNDSRFWIMN